MQQTDQQVVMACMRATAARGRPLIVPASPGIVSWLSTKGVLSLDGDMA
jgi:hypothetical protein